MNNVYDLVTTIVSRTEYINNWWKANPSKYDLSEDDEELMSSQLNELNNEVDMLKELVEKVRDIVG